MGTILVIDDNLQNRVLLHRYLTAMGMECLTAETGQEGFQLAKSHQPDVVVTDILMPIDTWDGNETLLRLKADPVTQHIPVIAVTAGGSQVEKHKDKFDAFLQMPLRLEELKAVVLQYASISS